MIETILPLFLLYKSSFNLWYSLLMIVINWNSQLFCFFFCLNFLKEILFGMGTTFIFYFLFSISILMLTLHRKINLIMLLKQAKCEILRSYDWFYVFSKNAMKKKGSKCPKNKKEHKEADSTNLFWTCLLYPVKAFL